MSDLAEKLDLSRFVPQNYPDLMYYKSYGCPPSPMPCPKVPCYTKDFFCSQWGPSFKCICPQRKSYRSPYQGVREELASMDYFTKLPENPQGCYPRFRKSPRFRSMAEQYALDEINDCPNVQPGWSPNCPENRKVFNLLHKDAVCGLCVPPNRARQLPVEPPPDCSDDCQPDPDDMYDLPFRVKVLGAWPQDIEKSLMKKSSLPKTGVARCLHPSSTHELQSVYKENFLDFFKTRTRQQLKLYRSPLAIDISRPRLSIPSNPQRDLVLSGPITVNAVPLVMRPKGPQKLPRNVGPECEVIVQVILVNRAYGEDPFFELGYGVPFPSLQELQSQTTLNGVDPDPNLERFNAWEDEEDSTSGVAQPKNPIRQKFEEAELQRGKNRLEWADSPLNPLNQEDSPKIKEQLIHDLIKTRSSLSSEYSSSSGESPLVTFSSSIWNKRGAANDTTKGEKMTTTQTDAEAYAQDDKMLLELLPNKKCYNSLTLCSNYLNKYDCTMSCYLNRCLEKPNTKFLYRLLHQYKYFARFLCPTLGSIYDEIPNIIRKGIKRNRLSSFLKAIGISAKPEDRDLDFIKNAPTALFNNLVKFGNGIEFGIIKPIIDAAEASVMAEMSGKGLSRMRYSNPVCRGVDQKSWVFSMVNTMTKHPHVSDMFLKGYWTTSRALSNGVPYPLDGLFTAWLTGMRVMAGADCTFISYAEQGTRFKCSQKAPIEEILEVFKKEAEIKKNPMNWMVCGAHQVRFPKWFKNKVRKNLKSGGVAGRSDVGDDNEEEMTAMPEGDSDPGSDVEKVVSNPDEFYDDNDT